MNPLPFSFLQGASGVVIPDPDIVWWKMNEGSGTTVEGFSTNGGDDATTNCGWSSSTPGATSPYCVTGNGTTQSVASNSTIVYGTPVITVSLWIYFNDITTSSRPFAALSDNGIIYYNQSGVFWFGFNIGGGYTQSTFSTPATGAWHHYLAVLDNTTPPGTITAWLDGSPISLSVASTGAGSGNFPTDTLYAFYNGSSFFLNGRIDDVRVFSGDQSAYVSAIYNDPQ